MNSVLNPYLSFKDNAREAMEFYKNVFGGKLTLSTFKENHVPLEMGEENLIMHSDLVADNGIRFMAADTPKHMTRTEGNNMGMSISGDNEKELTDYFNKLAAGGKVTQKLEKAPWGDTFGMLTDKFGINWLVNILAKKG